MTKEYPQVMGIIILVLPVVAISVLLFTIYPITLGHSKRWCNKMCDWLDHNFPLDHFKYKED